MKRVLSDKNVPRPLLRLLTAFDVETAVQRGWDELENGALLNAVEKAGFDLLLTADKSMENEQRFAGRSIGAVVMSTNDWRSCAITFPRSSRGYTSASRNKCFRLDAGIHSAETARTVSSRR